MRHWTPLLICVFAASCASTPVLWHRPTPEEKEREELRVRENEAEERRQLAEKRRNLDAVIQAFSLNDVRDCKRLGLVSYLSLDDARHTAVRMGGNRILAQRRRSYYTFHHPRGVDDYEIYQCPSPAEPDR
jgi:hypothetical protein